jgi:molybdopterin/thiamine biosynthesis adenylyltransferase
MIRGWDQAAISASRALVCGRGWSGCYTVWALASLGVGETIWMGRPDPATEAFSEFLTGDFAGGLGANILDYPLEPRRPEELDWVLAGQAVRMIIQCSGRAAAGALAEAAARMDAAYLDVSCVARDFAGEASLVEACAPVPSMLAAALAADEFRHLANPLYDDGGREFGNATLPVAARARAGRALLVGVGGIGAYCAALLAAARVPLTLVDCDVVEHSNLNRQGLFTAEDANARAPKAGAAAARLARLFPGQSIAALAERIGPGSEARVRSAAASAIVSAVDNAATRLALSALGARLGIPVVQAGTDVFSADCFVQTPGGAPLDEQMHGALSAAAGSERPRAGGGCAASPSYVAPGMVAGAFAAARALSVLAGAGALPSLHWRSGSLPCERREIRDEFAMQAE